MLLTSSGIFCKVILQTTVVFDSPYIMGWYRTCKYKCNVVLNVGCFHPTEKRNRSIRAVPQVNMPMMHSKSKKRSSCFYSDVMDNKVPFEVVFWSLLLSD